MFNGKLIGRMLGYNIYAKLVPVSDTQYKSMVFLKYGAGGFCKTALVDKGKKKKRYAKLVERQVWQLLKMLTEVKMR